MHRLAKAGLAIWPVFGRLRKQLLPACTPERTLP